MRYGKIRIQKNCTSRFLWYKVSCSVCFWCFMQRCNHWGGVSTVQGPSTFSSTHSIVDRNLLAPNIGQSSWPRVRLKRFLYVFIEKSIQDFRFIYTPDWTNWSLKFHKFYRKRSPSILAPSPDPLIFFGLRPIPIFQLLTRGCALDLMVYNLFSQDRPSRSTSNDSTKWPNFWRLDWGIYYY